MKDQKLTEIEDNWMSNEVEFNSGPIGLNELRLELESAGNQQPKRKIGGN